MSRPHLDALASDPRSRPSDPVGAAGLAAAVHHRVQACIVRLARIAGALVQEMSGLTDQAARRPDGRTDGRPDGGRPDLARADLVRAWALMARATGWLRALQVRVVADLMAKLAAMRPAPQRPEREAPAERRPAERAEYAERAERREPLDRCIAGKPLDEIVAQICADLVEAATLFGRTETAREIAAIAVTVRDLLGGPAEGWTPEPVAHPAASGPALAAAPAAPQGVARPPRAPDSG